MYSHASIAVLAQLEQGEWFRHRLGLHNVSLVEDPLLKEPVAVSREARTIWVPEALDFDRIYRRANEALRFIIGGATWAPLFSRQLEQSEMGTVIPFQRPGTSLGVWRGRGTA